MFRLIKDILKSYTLPVLITVIIWSGYGTVTGIITGAAYFTFATATFVGVRIPYQDDANGSNN